MEWGLDSVVEGWDFFVGDGDGDFLERDVALAEEGRSPYSESSLRVSKYVSALEESLTCVVI